VPSVQLDELCIMLWDMVRYHNYDIRSPYNRDAALWVANQTAILFPTDPRSLRDLRAALGRVASSSAGGSEGSANGSAKSLAAGSKSPIGRVRRFVARYGRVFGSTAGVESRSPAAEGQALPANSELHALVTAEIASRVGESAADGEPRREEGVLILEPGPEPEPETSPVPPSPPPPQREVPRPASEEILFIE
jgi:hypothetical protein